jgi:hypothetical protein
MFFRIIVDQASVRRVLSRLQRLRNEIDDDLNIGLRRTSVEMEAAARRGALRLPRRGGLAERVAKSKFKHDIKRHSGRVTLEFTAESQGGFNLALIDRGVVTHPVFGHSPWITQTVPAGWFSEPIEAVTDNMLSREIEPLIRASVEK